MDKGVFLSSHLMSYGQPQLVYTISLVVIKVGPDARLIIKRATVTCLLLVSGWFNFLGQMKAAGLHFSCHRFDPILLSWSQLYDCGVLCRQRPLAAVIAVICATILHASQSSQGN